MIKKALLSLITLYRWTLSPFLGSRCRFHPSCSAYAVGAVQQHGALKGSALTVARLARCHPWAQGGVDDVPAHPRFAHGLTPHGFVVPVSTRKD